MAEKYTDEPSRSGAEGGAQIYRSRKGFPLWLWPLLGLLLLALFYFLTHRNTGSQLAQGPPTSTIASGPSTPAASPTTSSSPAGDAETPSASSGTGAAGKNVAAGKNIKVHSGSDIATAKPGQASVPGVPLSNVVIFASAVDPATFVGRKAKLTNVLVQKVITERAFFVGPRPQQQMLVLLDKGMDAGASVKDKVTVATGSPISLIGVVEAMPTQEAINQTYGVTGTDYASLKAQKTYLHATVVQQK